jgi:CBS domain containing-hemolysin-like protein
LSAERHGRLDRLGYLDDPLQLFVPVRLLQGFVVAVVAGLCVRLAAGGGLAAAGLVALALVVLVVVCWQLIPLLLVRQDPEGVLELLLPSFQVIVQALRPLTVPLVGLLRGVRHRHDVATDSNGGTAPAGAVATTGSTEARAQFEEQAERELLQSVVEFGDTLVREVMTPRPDIVAVKATATLDELRNVFAVEQYSRLPVYRDSLDTILGFVFVRDLVGLTTASGTDLVVERLLRPAHTVPETKRVAVLLKELQRERVQSAIVHDEYGGTAGLVTIEDLLEEIVGEIRDEYDVEAEPIIDEGAGSFVFNGRVSVDDMSKRLDLDIEPKGFETVAGYLLSRLGRVPRAGESFEVDELCVDVLDAERRRVHRVRLRRRPVLDNGARA